MAKGGDGGTDGRTDRRTEGRMSRNSPLCPTGHRPFGAAAQKGENERKKEKKTRKKGKRKRKKKNKGKESREFPSVFHVFVYCSRRDLSFPLFFSIELLFLFFPVGRHIAVALSNMGNVE